MMAAMPGLAASLVLLATMLLGGTSAWTAGLQPAPAARASQKWATSSAVPCMSPPHISRHTPIHCNAKSGGGFFGALKRAAADFDEAAWDMFQGRKERIWSPDRRPVGERGAFNFSASTLSWGQQGRAITDEVAQTLRAVAETPADAVSAENDAMLLGDGRGGLAGELAGKLATEAQVPVNPSARETDGRELAELCFAKYGRYHDMTLLRNKVFDGQWQVAFNIYGPCLGQRSFSYTEKQYLEKLDTAALMLNSFDQAWFVKEFLTQPIQPRAGLPSRPRPDSAVTLRLNNSPSWREVDPELVEEWFAITGLGG